jgi:hypothetical protein
MPDLMALEEAKHEAFTKYQQVKNALSNNPENLAEIAQRVNDAWLEYKRIENEFVNKKSRELFGAY